MTDDTTHTSDPSTTGETDDANAAGAAGDPRTTGEADDADTAGAADDPITATELSVPVDAPQYDCRYCDRVFARERHRDLHQGQTHPDRVDEPAAAAYRSAVESEWESLVRYRYVALGTLVVLYFGFLVAFAVVGV